MIRNRLGSSLAMASLLIAALAGVTGCSALTQNTPSPSASAATSATTSTAPPTPSSTGSTTITLVNPNTASENEIAEALEEHGVPDARRWASAIKANAPYSRDDAMGKLSNIVKDADLNLLDMGKVNEIFSW